MMEINSIVPYFPGANTKCSEATWIYQLMKTFFIVITSL